jgi:chromosome segregation ATPase
MNNVFGWQNDSIRKLQQEVRDLQLRVDTGRVAEPTKSGVRQHMDRLEANPAAKPQKEKPLTGQIQTLTARFGLMEQSLQSANALNAQMRERMEYLERLANSAQSSASQQLSQFTQRMDYLEQKASACDSRCEGMMRQMQQFGEKLDYLTSSANGGQMQQLQDRLNTLEAKQPKRIRPAKGSRKRIGPINFKMPTSSMIQSYLAKNKPAPSEVLLEAETPSDSSETESMAMVPYIPPAETVTSDSLGVETSSESE